jgi:hypothetical protein
MGDEVHALIRHIDPDIAACLPRQRLGKRASRCSRYMSRMRRICAAK